MVHVHMHMSDWLRITIIFMCNTILLFKIKVHFSLDVTGKKKNLNLPFPSGPLGPLSDGARSRATPVEAVPWTPLAGLVSGDYTCTG